MLCDILWYKAPRVVWRLVTVQVYGLVTDQEYGLVTGPRPEWGFDAGVMPAQTSGSCFLTPDSHQSGLPRDHSTSHVTPPAEHVIPILATWSLLLATWSLHQSRDHCTSLVVLYSYVISNFTVWFQNHSIDIVPFCVCVLSLASHGPCHVMSRYVTSPVVTLWHESDRWLI